MQGNNIGYKIKQKLTKTQYADDFEHLLCSLQSIHIFTAIKIMYISFERKI